jgi:hypothetical protein
MSLSNIKNQGSSTSTSGTSKPQKNIKRVVDIILSKDHPAYHKYGGEDSIGIIFFTDEKKGEKTQNPSNLPTAKPKNLNNYTPPFLGDLVEITQAPGNDYYPSMGGKSTYTENYYGPSISVHNNAGSNALPLNTGNETKNNTNESQPNFSFQKEFRSQSQQHVERKLDNYLRDKLGFPSGRNDQGAPTYSLSQESNGDYIFKLDESKENTVKLGKYWEENKNQKNLNPTEGGTIIQGTNGQRINFLSTGPAGTNVVSNNVTDDPNDGNPTMGNAATILSVGKGSQENIKDDAASIYMLEDNNVNIDVSSNNIDSLKSTYSPYQEPIEILESEVSIPVTSESPIDAPEVILEEFNFADTSSVEVNENIPTQGVSEEDDPFSDPVFDALDVAQDEGLLYYTEEGVDWPENVEYPPPSEPNPTPPSADAEIPITDETKLKFKIPAAGGWVVRNDAGGQGTWHAPRSGGTLHKGTDLVSEVLSPIYAPIDGIAQSTRATTESKLPGVKILGKGKYEGWYAYMFYVKATAGVLQANVTKGQLIASQMALQQSNGGDYPEDVTDHVHVSIRKINSEGKYIPVETTLNTGEVNWEA